ncbi:hypothetical protein JMA_04740 [Jeotgalibacillus malaysiensis]|uniref:Uncharacterized protein n=1 Tax=Jeotgalibacillus malaysiensis TaxID=1508404 RepID=A0A0B5AIA9_9BACL|nr:hypothetical protein [Jeotgalibacillus malaysiensis]AJD89791.1 hypothetical protein JMA_04740 [Jeotgalibacillus malaysiensis]
MGIDQKVYPQVSAMPLSVEKILYECPPEHDFWFYPSKELLESWTAAITSLLNTSVYRGYGLSIKEERKLSALTSHIIVHGCKAPYLIQLTSYITRQSEKFLKQYARHIHHSAKEVLNMIELVHQFEARCKLMINRKANIILLPSAGYSESACTLAD